MSKDLNILPISPLHSFSFIEKEPPELRPAIMETCFLFIDLCDEVWVYLYPGVVSNGQTLEMYYCIATNKKMVYKIIENEGD